VRGDEGCCQHFGSRLDANELGRRWICNDALFVENHKKAREVTTNDE